MTEDTELTKKREEIKHRLVAGEYKSLVKMVADKVNLVFQKSTRLGPLPFWLSITVMVVIISLFGSLLSIVISGFIFNYERDFLNLLTVGFMLVFFIAIETNTNLLFTFFKEHLLDSLEVAKDLADIQNWLDTTFSRAAYKKQLFVGLVVSIIAILFVGVYSSVITNALNIGLFLSNWILVIFGGSYFYIFYNTLSLSGRLRQYQIKLYKANPSSSEVLDHLTDLFNFNMYTVAILVTIVTFITFGASLQRS